MSLLLAALLSIAPSPVGYASATLTTSCAPASICTATYPIGHVLACRKLSNLFNVSIRGAGVYGAVPTVQIIQNGERQTWGSQIAWINSSGAPIAAGATLRAYFDCRT